MMLSFSLLVPLILTTTFLFSSIHGQTLDCSFQGDGIDLKGDGTFLLRQSINKVTSTINVELEYIGIGWVGISFTQSTLMVPNVAIIGLPDDNTVMKYDLTIRDISGVLPAAADVQTLTETSIVQENGSTIMKFSRALAETDETTVATGSNMILVAYGFSNTLARHSYRLPTTATFTECLVAGSTAAPVAPVAPATPAPVAAAPVAAPAPGGGNTGIDLGNGRKQSSLSFQDGAVGLTFITDSVAQTLSVTMVYAGLGWLAFAVSDDIFMPNSNAVIALPDDGTGQPQKMDIGASRDIYQAIGRNE
jgi:hypothetical protein